MKTQYIKIIKCDNDFWYKKYVNNILEVYVDDIYYDNTRFYLLTDNNTIESITSLFVCKTDCIILNREEKLKRILRIIRK